jgi:hypothetical protein
MDLIKKWLSGSKNFIVGAVLYKKFGTDEKLKKLFEGRPDAYSQKRLEEELAKLLQKPKLVAQSPKKISDADEMPVSKDPVLKALRNEWLPLYKRMCYLQQELDRYEGNSEEAIAKRKPIAFEILELEQNCMVIWERRRHYEKNGSLPEVKESTFEIPTDPVELGKWIEATQRNIRRNKQLAAKHPDKPEFPLRQKQYEEKLEAIMKKVNNGKQSS